MQNHQKFELFTGRIYNYSIQYQKLNFVNILLELVMYIVGETRKVLTQRILRILKLFDQTTLILLS